MQRDGWRIDLSPAYENVKHISRTVIHLLPGYVAVLDRAELDAEVEDHGRGGILLEQHHEPYAEILATGTSFSFLPLFAITDASTEHERWVDEEAGIGSWTIRAGNDRCRVRLDEGTLSVTSSSGERSLSTEV